MDLGEKFNRLVDEARHVATEERRALESGTAELNTPEKVAASEYSHNLDVSP